jgi:hypothetical protein
MIRYACDKCGEACWRYPSRTSRRMFCSRACHAASREGENNPNYRAVPDQLCAQCAGPVPWKYDRRLTKARYCSRACKAAAERKPRDLLPPRETKFAAMYAGEPPVGGRSAPVGWEDSARAVPGLDGYFVTQSGVVIRHTGRVLQRSRHSDPDGYWRVTIYLDRKQVRCRVHSLVACTWLGPRPSPRHLVAHWDGDRSNCHVDNLRWATGSENWEDMRRHGRVPRRRRRLSP